MLVESTDGTGVGASVGGMPRPLNAFQVLMSSSSRIVLPLRILSEAIRGDHAIYNKFLHILEDGNFGVVSRRSQGYWGQVCESC